jgi:hypothetical protein
MKVNAVATIRRLFRERALKRELDPMAMWRIQ